MCLSSLSNTMVNFLEGGGGMITARQGANAVSLTSDGYDLRDTSME